MINAKRLDFDIMVFGIEVGSDRPSVGRLATVHNRPRIDEMADELEEVSILHLTN